MGSHHYFISHKYPLDIFIFSLPAPVRDKLVAAIRKAMADPEVLGRVRALGGDVFSGDAAVFLASQQTLWSRVIKERGITRE